MSDSIRRWLLVALSVLTFGFALGGRGLNEPDEGRYAVIAQEMLERRDWLVPHLWYLPHLDKPPVTYWLVAASLGCFGANEWAVRLPLALAGLSGVCAAGLLASALGGRRAGFWAAIILQTTLLYQVMARMLTTDIILTQFVAWSAYFFWRSWRTLGVRRAPERGGAAGPGVTVFLGWTLAGWLALALGFLTKGPVALAVTLLPVLVLLGYRWRDLTHRGWPVVGALAGACLAAVVVLPWFLLVFSREPQAAEFMVFGQAVGHALGTTIKDRGGPLLYYFAILAVGFLPWTVLLGWLWRRAHWRGLTPVGKEGWLFLSVWALFPFVLFSFSRAKLPAYILPMFPPLAVLVALRWFSGPQHDARPFPQQPGLRLGSGAADPACVTPAWAWRACALAGAATIALLPAVVYLLFKPPGAAWLIAPAVVAALALTVTLWVRRSGVCAPRREARLAAVWSTVNLMLFALTADSFAVDLKSNQTLKPVGLALRAEHQAGDVIVCWGRFPQGLPFYAAPAINAANRPYFGGMPLNKVPFEFPGNRQRLGSLWLPDEAALAGLLHGPRRVWLVVFHDTLDGFRRQPQAPVLREVLECGQWKLLCNRAAKRNGA